MSEADPPFKSQQFIPAQSVIQPFQKAIGAPFPPIPPSFSVLPDSISAVAEAASADELALAKAAREPFLLRDRRVPFMTDVVRANRLIRGKRIYIEIGIFDRGNLAYVSNLLADDAIIIGVDIEANAERDTLIQKTIKRTQTCHIVIGNSTSPKTVAAVHEILSGRKADAVFIDGGHDAFTVMHDYVNYGGLTSGDGVVLFHDSMWEGNNVYKGVADVLDTIDRLDPVYLVAANRPCHRFMRPLWREPIWGVVGIVPMKERLCYRQNSKLE